MRLGQPAQAAERASRDAASRSLRRAEAALRNQSAAAAERRVAQCVAQAEAASEALAARHSEALHRANASAAAACEGQRGADTARLAVARASLVRAEAAAAEAVAGAGAANATVEALRARLAEMNGALLVSRPRSDPERMGSGTPRLIRAASAKRRARSSAEVNRLMREKLAGVVARAAARASAGRARGRPSYKISR